MHQAILARKRSVNSNNIIQCKAKGLINCDMELRKNLRLTVINIQSIQNKDTNLLDHLVENKTGICIVTETWLNEDDQIWLECCNLSKMAFKLNQQTGKTDREED